MTANHALSFPAMAPDKGRVISFEAVDAAGKDTTADLVVSWLEKSGKTVFNFDTRGFADIPIETDVLRISEPGHWGIGKAIRGELMKDPGFDVRYIADAYALDREALYRRVVLPFLSARPGRTVIQIRGLMSSLAYQTVQAEDQGVALGVPDLLELPGNKLELTRRPDIIFLLVASEETLRKRQEGRSESMQKDIFGKREFQARVAKRYQAPDVQAPFLRLDTKIIKVSAEGEPEQVAARCIAHIVAHMPQAAP
ncbi:MAG TPA: dTMP kinase [Verrucomicrobiae bacterium]|nr:dTMP kinase [Verrucomicrobiae bacterium]